MLCNAAHGIPVCLSASDCVIQAVILLDYLQLVACIQSLHKQPLVNLGAHCGFSVYLCYAANCCSYSWYKVLVA